jgi:uncharacterized protein (TIGR02757 family)
MHIREGKIKLKFPIGRRSRQSAKLKPMKVRKAAGARESRPAHTARLREVLNGILRECDYPESTGRDPIMFPMGYKDRGDMEAAGFLASAFAYGRVGHFTGVIRKILSIMGKRPSEFLMDFDPGRMGGRFGGIRYRFNRTEDIICLLYVMHVLLSTYGSLEGAFMSFYTGEDADTGPMLSGLALAALRVDTAPVYGSDIRPVGLRQFFPSPANGSACKRACLFLRWMVRDADMDFGLWKGIPKKRLVVPLDTHVARAARCLGLTERKSQGWRTALEITRALGALDPEDPLKYDFALCHMGISGVWRRAEGSARSLST